MLHGLPDESVTLRQEQPRGGQIFGRVTKPLHSFFRRPAVERHTEACLPEAQWPAMTSASSAFLQSASGASAPRLPRFRYRKGAGRRAKISPEADRLAPP